MPLKGRIVFRQCVIFPGSKAILRHIQIKTTHHRLKRISINYDETHYKLILIFIVGHIFHISIDCSLHATASQISTGLQSPYIATSNNSSLRHFTLNHESFAAFKMVEHSSRPHSVDVTSFHPIIQLLRFLVVNETRLSNSSDSFHLSIWQKKDLKFHLPSLDIPSDIFIYDLVLAKKLVPAFSFRKLGALYKFLFYNYYSICIFCHTNAPGLEAILTVLSERKQTLRFELSFNKTKLKP